MYDYWQGKSVLRVVEATATQSGPGFGGADAEIAMFKPESGFVVPQGTAWVLITVTLSPADLDQFTDPQLWVKTATDTETVKIASLESGIAINMTSTNPQNDLPHQLLSAWEFQVRVQPGDAGFSRYKGEVVITVDAVRGLEIPLYPGHPDGWNGKTELTLLHATGTDAYLKDPSDGGCDGFDCQETLRPDAGVLVPAGALVVEATLKQGASPTVLGLEYHGPESRSFTRATPDADSGGVRHYTIPVEGHVDGPYATTSQWEFRLFIEGPVTDGAVVQDYDVTIVVKKSI